MKTQWTEEKLVHEIGRLGRLLDGRKRVRGRPGRSARGFLRQLINDRQDMLAAVRHDRQHRHH